MARSSCMMSTIMLMTFLYIVIIEFICVTTATGMRNPAAELGTRDGYDVGGTKPICYVTTIPKDPNNEPDTDGSNYTAIEWMNDRVFNIHEEESSNETNQAAALTLLPSVREFDFIRSNSCSIPAAQLQPHSIIFPILYIRTSLAGGFVLVVLQWHIIDRITNRYWYRSTIFDRYTAYLSTTSYRRCITNQ
jgi:hypothetical protein